MEDENLGRYEAVVSARVSPHIDLLLTKRAGELKESKSEVAREIITRYFEDEIQDPELIFASINDLKDKMRMQDKSLTLVSVLVTEMLRYLIKILPSIPQMTDEMAEKEFCELMNRCKKEIYKHKGMFDSWLLESMQGVM